MIASIRARDRAAFAQALKDYVLTLGKREEFGKLKSFLIESLLRDEKSIENQFLSELGIPSRTIFANALSLLKNVPGCDGLCELLESATH